jgi:hypothetical protein
MNNNWNDADPSRQLAAIHSYVVAALSTALLEWLWQGHEYVRSALPHRFECLPSGPLPQTPGGRWRIQASTQFLDQERAPSALLRLMWIKGELDVDSLLSAAWLIAHEFVCHVQRLPTRDGAPRAPWRDDCPFFEGWMDEVAYGLFHARVLSQPAEAGASVQTEPQSEQDVWVRTHLGEMARVATDCRRDRYGTGHDGKRYLFARQWELGAQAARVLRRFLASCTSYDQEERRSRTALIQMIGLSFRIQAAVHSPDELPCVVHGCLLAGQSGLSYMKNPERARLLQLLTQPIPDIAVWHYKLEALCRTFPV